MSRSVRRACRCLFMAAAVVGGGTALGTELETCNGPGQRLQLEGQYTVNYQVCTTTCPGIQPNCSEDCTWGSTTYNVYSCQQTPGGGEQGPIGPGSGGGSGPPPNPKDTNNDGKIDCWRQTLDTDEANKDLGPDQGLGSVFGGTNFMKPFHSGIDIDCNPGNPVYAPATGNIYFAGDNGVTGGGNVVFITYGTYRYDSLHMGSFAPGIVTGGHVTAGDLIGYCGNTGADSYHSHLRIVKQDGTPQYLCGEMNGFSVYDPEALLPCP